MDLRAAILSGILVFASLAFAPAADAQWNGGFQQDWATSAWGLMTHFAAGMRLQKKTAIRLSALA